MMLKIRTKDLTIQKFENSRLKNIKRKGNKEIPALFVKMISKMATIVFTYNAITSFTHIALSNGLKK